MNHRLLISAVVVASALAGCNNANTSTPPSPPPAKDKDGVPNIDFHGTIVPATATEVAATAELKRMGSPAVVPRHRMVTVDGKQMKLVDFYRTYCAAPPPDNANCTKAQTILRLDDHDPSTIADPLPPNA